MVHQRSEEAYELRNARRVARNFVMKNSFRDHKRAENICICYESEIEQHIWEQLKSLWTPEYVRGEVLVDSRGTGSLQK